MCVFVCVCVCVCCSVCVAQSSEYYIPYYIYTLLNHYTVCVLLITRSSAVCVCDWSSAGVCETDCSCVADVYLMCC